jgi:hypothetical protein
VEAEREMSTEGPKHESISLEVATHNKIKDQIVAKQK